MTKRTIHIFSQNIGEKQPSKTKIGATAAFISSSLIVVDELKVPHPVPLMLLYKEGGTGQAAMHLTLFSWTLAAILSSASSSGSTNYML